MSWGVPRQHYDEHYAPLPRRMSRRRDRVDQIVVSSAWDQFRSAGIAAIEEMRAEPSAGIRFKILRHLAYGHGHWYWW